MKAEDFAANASDAAKDLVREALHGLRPGKMRDYITHIFGHDSKSGCTVHSTTMSRLHPFRSYKFRKLLKAAGANSTHNLDDQVSERLLTLTREFYSMIDRNPIASVCLHAMDHHYTEGSEIVPWSTAYYVPNTLVLSLAKEYPESFTPVISIHPYRHDAIQELEQYAREGVRLVKWHPELQGIDMSSPLCLPFYRKLVVLDMVLMVYTGAESHITIGKSNAALSNPMLLTSALDAGVTVVAIHSASRGRTRDLQRDGRPFQSSFDLFFRMLCNPEYEGKLFGLLSGLTYKSRTRALVILLDRTELHNRFLYGSDYPLTACKSLVSVQRFVRRGMLTAAQGRALNEIFRYNPLLADFVLKRSLRGRNGVRFKSDVFVGNPWKVQWPPPRHYISNLLRSERTSILVLSKRARRNKRHMHESTAATSATSASDSDDSSSSESELSSSSEPSSTFDTPPTKRASKRGKQRAVNVDSISASV